ncbi:MAG TPA: hypothetical protein VKB80_11685 [Kofleriaceae bacterium]|nr:hypothetical protein [Kofleriaceae bacterium]
MPRARLSALAALALVAARAQPARAGDNDLVLARLADVVVDDSGAPVDAVGANQDFRSLASELGVVMAPRLAGPADTPGLAGFQFSADLAWTRVHTDRSYWRALAGSRDPAGRDHGGSFMNTVGLFARKGIWLPAPSFELGLGAVHLVDSQLWAAQGYAKLAVLEGFHYLAVPSIALRAGLSRMMGSSELELTVLSLDATVSKSIGVAGIARVSPYAGWNALVIVPRSQVIDKTPQTDPRVQPLDASLDFVFPDQDNILRNRLFAGVVVKHYIVSLSLEAALALRGSSKDDRSGTDVACGQVEEPTAQCDSRDRAGQQVGLTAALALAF